MIDEINNSDSPIDTFSRIVRDIQNLDFMNSLTKIYFKFFLKKLLERDTLILKALTM